MSDKLIVATLSSALVIDSSDSLPDYFNLILEGIGISNIITAVNGKKALDILDHTDDITLILCNLNMPEMDGIEVMRHLSERNYRGKIILISGEEHKRIIDSTTRLAEAYALNIIGALKKPVTIKSLCEVLAQAESQSRDLTQSILHEFSIDDLQHALDRSEFIIHIQPKINLHTQEVIGGEALARWQHPELGLISAEAFIHFFETHQLIYRLTDILLDQAMAVTNEICKHIPAFRLSFNISVDYLNRLNLPDLLLARCRKLGISPSNIIFELTESRLVKDFRKVLEIMTRLGLKGFGLSIDDFGTGYSSMEHLQNFPFDEMKIDKTFVTGTSANNSSRAIIESSVSLANKLDMRVVAEGVETYADWQFVSEMGCDIIQGYMVARPMSAGDFIDYINDVHYQTELKSRLLPVKSQGTG